MTKEQPRIAVIGTGGTISSLGRDGLDIVRYVETGKIYEVDELLNAFPETLEQADVVPVRLRAMPSTLVGPAEWLEIAAKIHETTCLCSELPILWQIATSLTHNPNGRAWY